MKKLVLVFFVGMSALACTGNKQAKDATIVADSVNVEAVEVAVPDSCCQMAGDSCKADSCCADTAAVKECCKNKEVK